MKKHRLIPVLFFLFLVLALTFAAAELQKKVQPVVTGGTIKGLPDIAYDAQVERYLVVWQDRAGRDAGDWDVRARMLDGDGNAVGRVMHLASSAGDERHPRAAASGAGSWTVVWSTGRSIEACTVDAEGKIDDFRSVTPDKGRFVDHPDIGCSGLDGRFFVVWEESGELGLSLIKGRSIGGSDAEDRDALVLGSSQDFNLQRPSVNQTGEHYFVAWEKPVDAWRVDIEGRDVAADTRSAEALGGLLAIAADGARNSAPSVAAVPGEGGHIVVWQAQRQARRSEISFAQIGDGEVLHAGDLTATESLLESRPAASGAGLAGRVIVTYQTAGVDDQGRREIAARTIGWGDTAVSAEITLDPDRTGGGNPSVVRAAGINGRGVIVWDIREGEGTELYSKDWVTSELSSGAVTAEDPIVNLDDFTISGTILFNGVPQADVLMSGPLVSVRTDALGNYSAPVSPGWTGTVTPVQPGFTFSPASIAYTNVTANVTGQNYTANYVGGAEDIYENNNSFESAADLPLGTTHDLILNDEEWFRFLVPVEDAGKDLKIHLWGTAFADTTTRRDLDFAILDASGKLLSYNTSGTADETAFVCNVAAGYYYVTQSYFDTPGTVYSLTAELSDAFGLGYVTGRVTDDSGTPIEGASVELYGVPTDWWIVSHPMTFTDADGNYTIGWYPGPYTVQFNNSGFWNDGVDWTPDANYLAKTYNWGEVLTLSPGATVADVDGALTPGGVITGRITDGFGSPFASAPVAYAYASDTTRLGSAVVADANGDYSISHLRAGNFAVRLRSLGSSPMINEWHDDQLQFASAGPIGVEAGVTTPGVDARLEDRTWGTITGRVTDNNGDPVGNLQVGIYDPAGISLWTVRTDGEGYYTHPRVPAGAWKVFFNATSIGTANLVSQFYPGTRFVGLAGTVQVTAAHVTEGIDIVLPAAGRISGQMLNNAGAVNLVAYDTASDFYTSVTVNPILPLYGPPTYIINNLAPGTYKVAARPNMQGDRIAHWYPGAASYAAAGAVTVTAGATTSGVDITLATGGGLITGRVIDAGGNPIAGVAVVAQDASRMMGYGSAPSNEEGYYTIRQVPAGTVKVYFNADANLLGYASEYYNDKPEYSTADPVTVTDGETTTLADAALAVRPALAVTTASLPGGEMAIAYNQQLAAVGGRMFHRWTVASGALPTGLTMSSSGLITGTPVTPGTFPFTVRVTDSTLPQQAMTQELSITIGAYTGQGFMISGTVTLGGSPLAGVVLSGLPGDPVTSSTGTYVAVVEPGFWNTVTPVLAGYAFDPPLRTYAVVTGNLPGQDYSAQPGYRLSGTITVGGAGLSGVRITGLPTEIRTNSQGAYSIMLPSGWGGTVIPVLTGFTFSPTHMDYASLLADAPLQDYTASYAGGADDAYENNDTFATAAIVPMGTVIPDLVLLDEDWFKFEVPAGDAGKVLGIRLFATAFPNGTAVSDPLHNKDLDFGVMDESGKLLTHAISGSVDEVAFIPDIQPGWYTIAHTYMPNPGMVYSLFVTVSDVLSVGTVSGRIIDEDQQGIDGITVELYKVPFDWNDSHPLAVTDADGNYKIAAFPGSYQIKVNMQDYAQNPNDACPDNWLPVRNYPPNSYNYDATVVVSPETPVTGADVMLEWAGAISGRVTDGEGNPLDQARVHAYLAGGIQASVAYTDADGNYTLRRLRSANYALLFRPPTGSTLAREWYNDLTTFAESLLVAATAEMTTTGIDAVLEAGGQISGHVTNENGDPVRGVTVAAVDASGVTMQGTTTQSDGSYLLNSLRPGTFTIVFNTSTCTVGNYMTRGHGSGEPVPVVSGQTTSNIDAVLYAAGAIAGRLTDQNDHGLMSGSVQAVNDATRESWGATIDYEGNYLIRLLPPGSYRVRFAYGYGSITNYPTKWYAGVNSGADATQIAVIAGETVNGIDGTLMSDGGGISGRVMNLYGGGIAGVTVQTEDGSFGGFATSRAITDADGYYTIQNVPTGPAKVHFRTGFTPFNEEFYNDKTDYGTADAVPIAPAAVYPDVNAVLSIRPSLTLVTTSLPAGELGVAYAQSLEASGGLAFFHWSIESGVLPPGLLMNSRGEISGIPTTQGTFAFRILLTDSSIPQVSWSQELSITIGEYSGVGHTIAGSITSGGSPLAGVVLSGLPGSPTTNASGGYIAVVSSGWNGTVTPVLSGYAFTPATISYANVSADFSGQDYAASAGYLISGTVRLDGVGQAGVLMSGLPGAPRTDAAGAYSASVAAGSTLTVTPTLPGFTFAPPNMTYTAIAANATGQDYVSTYAGGIDDPFEDNDSFATAAVIPMGTTSGLVLRDEDWFKVYVPAGDAGKDLRVHIWGTSYPDQTTRRDLDFGVLNAAGNLLSFSQSGSPDETAFICDVTEGWYYIAHAYVGLEGTVYSLTVDTNDDYGLAYVSGTVRDDENHALAGVNVELYGVPFNWDVSRPLVITDAAGNYKIGWAPGNYQVEFNLTDWSRGDTYDWIPDANYLAEVYNGGEVLALTAGATRENVDGQLTPGGVIAGRITDQSGAPLAMVWAYAHAGDTVQVSTNFTDANGNYRLSRLRTGNYAVRFRTTGTPQASEWYDDAAGFAGAMPIAVTSGATTAGIDASLGASGSIAGRVTNEQQEPVAGVQVIALDPAGIGLRSAATDANGNYSIGKLPTGAFKVQFNAAPATTGNYVSEYYTDAFYLNDAEYIDVTAGATTAGIDAELAAAGAITGTVTDGEGNPQAGATVIAFNTDGSFYLSATTDANGVYTIRNLPPDGYKVKFRPAQDLAVEWHDDKVGFTDADLVTVAAGATVSGIDGDFAAEFGTITGTVTNGLGAPIAGVTVIAQDAALAAGYYSTLTDAAGHYTLRRLPTCQAKVWFNADTGRLVYLSEFYNDKGDHGIADLVDVTVGETTSGIDAVLAEQPALTVTTELLAIGELAVPYNSTMESSGGRPFYHWSLESGALPDGLTLNGRGEISGTATMAGTFTFTMRVSDSTSPQQVATKELSITIGEHTGLGYTISGKILSGGNPLPGVVLSGLPGSPTTNSAGGYVAVVPDGWAGTVTPTLAGYVFDPVDRPYSPVSSNLSGQDYVATAGFRISGTVTLGGAGLGGVLMSGLPSSPVTAADGVYGGIVPVGWSGTVTPTLAGYTFTPATRTYTNVTANFASQDYTATAVGSEKKVDFNKDGQEDILWRYYGAGGYQGLNVIWFLNQSGTLSPIPLGANPTNVQGASVLLGTKSSISSSLPLQMGLSRTLASTSPIKSILTGKKVRAFKPKQVLRSPMDRGRAISAKDRKHAKDMDLRPKNVPMRKDAAAASALSSGTADLAALQMNTEVVFSLVPDTNWEIAGTADFDGDGDTDILWRYYGTGDYRGLNDIWFMNGTSFDGESVFSQVHDTNWRIVGTGDFDGDGDADILWRYCGTGDYQGLNVIWYMNGPQFAGETVFNQVQDTDWKIAGTGDFNGDGDTDILWRYYGTGAYQGLNVVWYMNGSLVAGETVFSQVTDTNWQIAGTGDFNSDGNVDILWRYYGAGGYQGLNVIWYMAGTTVSKEEVFSFIPDTNWRIVNR